LVPFIGGYYLETRPGFQEGFLLLSYCFSVLSVDRAREKKKKIYIYIYIDLHIPLYYLVFCCCDKIPEKNNLKEERLIWVSQLAGSMAFSLWQDRTIMVEGHGKGKLLTSRHPEGKDGGQG
jgi:hypothetical protein